MKKNLTKVMAMGMVLTMLGTATAFAEEATLISAVENTSIETIMAEAQEAAFISQSGKVVSVEASFTEGVQLVTIDNEQGGLRFAVDSNTIVVNREDGAYLIAADLTEGMEVAVVYDTFSPMGMSMPPYLGKVTAVVANADAGFFTVGHFDNDLTDMKNMLKLNISDKTDIQNLQGARIRLFAEDVKGQDALVFYGATTRSIPAQTTPSFVLLLTNNEKAEGEMTGSRAAEVTDAKEAVMVPLRETAEANGYTVKWQGKTKPILLEKDGVSMEITVGSDTYVVDGDMAMKAAMPSELKGGVTFVSSDIFK
ncbi:MAG: copper amine oxidase N-terminal domain-containing protein [Anaerotignum sp.]